MVSRMRQLANRPGRRRHQTLPRFGSASQLLCLKEAEKSRAQRRLSFEVERNRIQMDHRSRTRRY